MKKCANALIILIAAIISSCAGIQKRNEAGSIYGMVYDHENKPVQNVEISIGGKAVSASNINGRFTIKGLGFGTYEISFTKEGYETFSTVFEYSDATQLVYVKMISGSQLLAEAEKEMNERRWSTAEALIKRAEAVKPGDAPTMFLKAALKYRTGSAEEAKAILESLIAQEYNEPSIYLFLADIFQFKLEDKANAISNLKAFLQLRYDPEVEKRLKELEAEPAGE